MTHSKQKQETNDIGNYHQLAQKSGWILPSTNLNIPMPKVKPPKSVNSSTSSSAVSK